MGSKTKVRGSEGTDGKVELGNNHVGVELSGGPTAAGGEPLGLVAQLDLL